jgi:hypothetical protein
MPSSADIGSPAALKGYLDSQFATLSAQIAAVGGQVAALELQTNAAFSAAKKQLGDFVSLTNTTEAQLQSTLDAIKASTTLIGTGVTNLQTLVGQLEAGQPVSQSQLDALNNEAAGIQTALAGISTAPPAPPAAPTS